MHPVHPELPKPILSYFIKNEFRLAMCFANNIMRSPERHTHTHTHGNKWSRVFSTKQSNALIALYKHNAHTKTVSTPAFTYTRTQTRRLSAGDGFIVQSEHMYLCCFIVGGGWRVCSHVSLCGRDVKVEKPFHGIH